MHPTLRRLVGRVATVLLPGVVRDMESGAQAHRWPRLKQAMLDARLHRAARTGATDELQSVLAAGWRGGFGNWFHANEQEARWHRTLELHDPALQALDALLATGRFGRLVELGYGDGRALRHVLRGAPDGVLGIGLDLNDVAIAAAVAQSPGATPLTFVAGDGTAWLVGHPAPGTVLFTNGGVLEYIAPGTLEMLLQSLASAAPSAVVFIEPLDPAHDLAGGDTTSRIFGIERSFSHHYPARLAAAGFRSVLQSELQRDGVRWLMIAGETP